MKDEDMGVVRTVSNILDGLFCKKYRLIHKKGAPIILFITSGGFFRIVRIFASTIS